MLTESPAPGLGLALGITVAMLAGGSVARWLALRRADPDTRRLRLQSLRTWWLLFGALAAALAAGRTGVVLAVAAASFLALREFARLVEGAQARGALRVWYALALAYFGALLVVDDVHTLTAFAVVATAVAVPVAPLLGGHVNGFVRQVGGLGWGYVVLVVGLGHVIYLFIWPGAGDAPLGAAGWCLYLIGLTSVNDIAQAIIGRRFGSAKRHRLSPVVSPNKTWEGFLGAGLITTGLAIGLAPWLTGLHAAGAILPVPPSLAAAGAGLLIVVLGLLGDLNMSAVKRDAGVKDSGTLLPGMGGMIDRVDSLTFTAPAFYWYVRWLLP